MKLQIKAAFYASQKAQIVARGEEIGSIYTFEMAHKYAALFPRLRGDYHVTSEMIDLRGHAIKVAEYRNEAGKWINDYRLDDVIESAIADGSLKEGANCDPIMQKIEKLLNAKEAARQVAQQKADEDAARKERERPAREAQEAQEAEERRIEREAQDTEKAEQEATRQAKIKTAKAEKLAWIEAHGSERLRKGFAAGYHCQKIYTSERGKADLGSDYELDYEEDVERRDRSCPTLEALNEADRLSEAGIKAEVVWLPKGTATENDCYEYDCDMQQSCEAVEAILLGNYFYRTF